MTTEQDKAMHQYHRLVSAQTAAQEAIAAHDEQDAKFKTTISELERKQKTAYADIAPAVAAGADYDEARQPLERIQSTLKTQRAQRDAHASKRPALVNARNLARSQRNAHATAMNVKQGEQLAEQAQVKLDEAIALFQQAADAGNGTRSHLDYLDKYGLVYLRWCRRVISRKVYSSERGRQKLDKYIQLNIG